MEKDIQKVVSFLKELIDNNGEDYLKNETFKVYKELIDSKILDKNTSVCILHLLLSVDIKEVVTKEEDRNNVSKIIQKECYFNKKIADYLTQIFISLYSNDNKTEWKNNELVGLKEFIDEIFKYEWNGFCVWKGQGVTVDCTYDAEIILKPTYKIMINKDFSSLINKNKFITKKSIHDYYVKKLKKYLDDNFDDYCSCDDYYTPNAEDFGINLEEDLKSWCNDNGFEYISSEGEGEEGDFESPYSRYHGW